MSKIIQVEGANMKYTDDYDVDRVDIKYRYKGKILRNGHGDVPMDYEEFKEKADVESLEKIVKEAIIKELQEEDEGDADEEE